MYMQKLNLLFSIFLLTLILNSDSVNRRKVYLKEVIIEETVSHQEKISLLYSKKFSEYKRDLYNIVNKDKL